MYTPQLTWDCWRLWASFIRSTSAVWKAFLLSWNNLFAQGRFIYPAVYLPDNTRYVHGSYLI